jgi:uncharacterized protein YcnI
MKHRIAPVLLLTLCLLVSAPAGAHVALDPKVSSAGALVTGAFRVTHGCDGAPTTRVTITMPDGVTPRLAPGWRLSITKRALPRPLTLHGETITETVDTVTWEGGPLPAFAYEQFEVRFMTPATPGATLAFPVVQTCETGEHRWTALPGEKGEPAPTLRLSPAR